MTATRYQEWNPSPASRSLVAHAYSICVEYQRQGFDLTLRQLYYQFVARDLIPNNQRSYKNLGTVINRARLAGLLDWDYIVDRTRNLQSQPSWNDPQEILQSAAQGFKLDHWESQPSYVEVWIEKDALLGVIEPVCTLNDVPFFSCRGYTSQSEVHAAAQRLIYHEDAYHQDTIIIHLGDHDPSGIDMTRDIQDRLALFGARTHVRRIALNMNQVTEYDPPPNPTKLTDSRAQDYITRYGYDSWELDALDPQTLNDLIQGTIDEYRDQEEYGITRSRESDMKDGLQALTEIPWDVIQEFTEEQR